MNKTFRIVWSQARACHVVSHEKAAAKGKGTSSKALATAVVAGTLAFPLSSWATVSCSLTGDGSAGTPYQVASSADLGQVGLTCGMSSSYLQTADITLTGTNNLAPIGSNSAMGTSGQPFTGTYDGGNYTISGLNQSNASASADYRLGLFGYMTNGTIKNLKLTNATLSLGSTSLGSPSDYIYAGVLVGRIYPSSAATIKNVSVSNSTVSVSTTSAGNAIGGGVIGAVPGGSTTVSYSSANNVTVNGSATGSGYVHVGGFAGALWTGTYSSISSSGSVQATHTGAAGNQLMAGGLVGSLQANVALQNVYSSASVTAIATNGIIHWGIGGLIGLAADGSINNAYSTGAVNGTQATALCTAGRCGGMLGTTFSTRTSINNFWDTTTSGKASSPLGTGKTTAEMKTASTFTGAGWSSGIWNMVDGAYPTLLPQNDPPTVTVGSITGTAALGQTLTGSYSYSDTESNAEDTGAGGSSYQWKSGSTTTASSASAISGATGDTAGSDKTYTPVAADLGNYLFYCVTPKASAGASPGSESCSAAIGPIAGGSLSSVSATASSTLINATNVTYTLNFTTANAIPAGNILFWGAFPTGINLPSMADISECSSKVTVSFNGNPQTLSDVALSCSSFSVGSTRNGLQINNKNVVPANTPVSIQITGVSNPTGTGAASFSTFKTATGSGTAIDTPSTLPSITYSAVGAPIVSTGASSDISQTGATLSGTVSDNGGTASVSFDYGTTTSYGTNAAATTGGSITAGAGSTAVAKTVSGLSCGTTYHYRVVATNSAGTTNGSDQALSTSACPPPPPPVSPFNASGTTTVTALLSSGSTSTAYTPATNSLISNLSNLGNSVGLSENGVIVVLNNSIKEPVKLQDNPPDNVLFSLPSAKPVAVQFNGNTVNVTVNTEKSSGTAATVLGTTSLTLPDGTQTKGLQVVQGQAQMGTTLSNGVIGGLELSKDATLRGVLAQAGNQGGTASFLKNTDASGAISGDSGEVVVTVRLKQQPTQPTDMLQRSNSLAANAMVTLTLKAGEVAKFDAKGELIGVYAGSLSGTAGKTGDSFATTAPKGLSSFPAKVIKLDGNTLDRLGSNLLPAFADTIANTGKFAAASTFSITQDSTTGIVTAKSSDQPALTFFGLPVGVAVIDPNVADGTIINSDGTVTWTAKGVSLSFAPMSGALSDMASTAKQLGYDVLQVRDNGTLVFGGSGISLLALPRFEARNTAQSVGFSWNPAEFRASYTDNQGNTQSLDPMIYDSKQFDASVAAMSGWILSREYALHGGIKLSGPKGEQFVLTPDYGVLLDKVTQANYDSYNGRFVYRYQTGFLPSISFSQSFTVK